MQIPDLNYYQTVVDTQTDPEILKAELQDFIQEVSEFLRKSKETKGTEKAKHYCCNCAYWHKRGEKCAACYSGPEKSTQ